MYMFLSASVKCSIVSQAEPTPSCYVAGSRPLKDMPSKIAVKPFTIQLKALPQKSLTTAKTLVAVNDNQQPKTPQTRCVL